MSKFYVSEQELREIFDSRFANSWKFFAVWLETKLESGEIELVEFDYYEISNLKCETGTFGSEVIKWL